MSGFKEFFSLNIYSPYKIVVFFANQMLTIGFFFLLKITLSQLTKIKKEKKKAKY